MIYTPLYHPVMKRGWMGNPLQMFGDRGFWDNCASSAWKLEILILCRVIYRMIPKTTMILWDAMTRSDTDNVYISADPGRCKGERAREKCF